MGKPCTRSEATEMVCGQSTRPANLTSLIGGRQNCAHGGGGGHGERQHTEARRRGGRTEQTLQRATAAGAAGRMPVMKGCVKIQTTRSTGLFFHAPFRHRRPATRGGRARRLLRVVSVPSCLRVDLWPPQSPSTQYREDCIQASARDQLAARSASTSADFAPRPASAFCRPSSDHPLCGWSSSSSR